MRECKQAFTLFFLFSRVFFGRARTLLYLLCKFDGVKSSNLLSRPTRGAWIEIRSCRAHKSYTHGRAPHGARGLKYGGRPNRYAGKYCRAPHGARGLKWNNLLPCDDLQVSRPTRGAWIEIDLMTTFDEMSNRRAPHGARGLKFLVLAPLCIYPGRAPHGARGLKC